MGAGYSRQYEWQEIEELKGITKFSSDELGALKAQFMEMAGSTFARLTRRQFHQMLSKRGEVFEESAMVLDHLFELFDANRDGSIDFKEFCTGLALFSKGKMEDRLRVLFHLYDVDGNGSISKSELVQVVFLLQSALDVCLFHKHHREAPGTEYSSGMGALVQSKHQSRKDELKQLRSWADSFFATFDTDRNDVLTFEEFRNAVLRTPELRAASKAGVLNVMHGQALQKPPHQR